MRLIRIALVCFLITVGLLYWANQVISDPNDECQDSSLNITARFIACTMEGK
jgi:hypothetical protein